MSTESTRNKPRNSDFVAEVNSTFEPILIEKVCEPLLRLVPERVHPNTISLLAHVVCWTTAAMATLSPYGGPIGQPLLLAAAAFGIFA
ncbi:MAG: hypothetical protein JRI55_08240, partial [Deltaproteobacteria bacterium]|nr:hypothetical protein [Deltaproteobacteria bacterium]